MRYCTKSVFVLVLLAIAWTPLIAGPKSAEAQVGGTTIIPATRRIDWQPGIPGGINSSPYTTTLNVKNYGAAGNGATDDTSAIQAAVNAAGDYAVVYLPPGTYRTTAPIRLKSKMILRGAGPSQTKIVNYATANEILGANGSAGSESAVTAGYTKGSTQVTVSNGSIFSIGDVILISQDNGEPFSNFDDTPSFYRRTIGQLNSVKGKNGNIIELNRPLYYSYNPSYNIMLTRYDSVVFGLGVEDLYLERATAGGDHNIYIENGYRSWVKNIESNKAKNWHVALYSCFQCEVRDSYIHHAAADAGGNADYGVQLFKRTTDTLVENNIFDRTRHAMILEWGGQGNVFGYNYSINPINEGMEGTDYLMADMVSHGGTPMFNLWEGNIAQNFDMDNILGGSLYETAFRNWIQAKSIPSVGPGSQWGIEFQKHNYYGNVIGNILMKPGDTGDYEYIANQSGRAVYRLGFKSSNDDSQDPQSRATLLRHMNYDYITGSTKRCSDSGEPGCQGGNGGTSIPASLYRSSKPSWFGSLDWPPFGPDPNNPGQIFVKNIPAAQRFGTSGGGGPTPIYGQCGTTLNACIAGTLNNTTDSSTQDLWQCVGSNGGGTASCNLPKTTSGSSGGGAVKAFPGAEGYGAIATGGRSGRVIEVTNLNDSGPGSLRAALTATGPRIMVFRVSGTITLNSEIYLNSNHSNLTIAGQTAPGDGITIRGHQIFFENADNLIIRYIRFRLGAGFDEDAIGGLNSDNVILDHVTASWGVDENLSFYGGDNLTLQNSIISEGIYFGGNEKGTHSMGGIISGRHASIHHNLFVHNAERNPLFVPYSSFGASETVDIRNNVVYNWAWDAMDAQENSDSYINIVNNYFKAGPATKEPYWFVVVGSGFNPTNAWYVNGNYIAGSPVLTADNWATGSGRFGIYPKKPPKANNPYNVASVTTHSAQETYNYTLDNAGANFPKRDSVDSRIVNEVRNGTATYGGSYGAGLGIIDSQDDVGGWPTLVAGTALTDTDHDGMPDSWETPARGLNPSDPSDGPKVSASGYTNVEDYINNLVTPGASPPATPPTNQPPTVSITSPRIGQNFPTATAAVTVNVSALDVDGVDEVHFYDGNVFYGSDKDASCANGGTSCSYPSSFSFTFGDLTAGAGGAAVSHTLRAVALDSQGASASAAVIVTVGTLMGSGYTSATGGSSDVPPCNTPTVDLKNDLKNVSTPCPVLSVSVPTAANAPVTIGLTVQPRQYVWNTIFVTDISNPKIKKWIPKTIPSCGTDGWCTSSDGTGHTLTLTPTALSALGGIGVHYVASWDWTWNGTCWLGPGATACDTPGKWRVQKFEVE